MKTKSILIILGVAAGIAAIYFLFFSPDPAAATISEGTPSADEAAASSYQPAPAMATPGIPVNSQVEYHPAARG